MRSPRPATPCARKKISQRGSAILFILLGVALFGALCYSFMKGMRGNTSSFTTQQAKLTATEIINSSHQVERAVQKMMMNGCSQDEISMENAPNRVGILWENSMAPDDKSCHLFDPQGGKLPDTTLTTGPGTQNFWVFSGHLAMSNINPTKSIYGIAAYLRGLSDDVCKSVNSQMGVAWASLIPSQTAAHVRMHYNPSRSEGILPAGVPHYISCDALTHPDASAEEFCPVKTAGCFNLNGENIFYRYVTTVRD